MYLYILEMCRWADNNNHSYYSSAHTSLLDAINSGLNHCMHRGNKYQPQIYMTELDGDCHNILCRNTDEARQLYKELAGREWSEKEIEE